MRRIELKLTQIPKTIVNKPETFPHTHNVQHSFLKEREKIPQRYAELAEIYKKDATKMT